MNQSNVELFLDEGWNLIGRLHLWLSKNSIAITDDVVTVEIIAEAQSFWTLAENLGVHRISRVTLALEQLLERLCARNLELNAECLSVLTRAVSCLQEMLLVLEATREETNFSDPTAVQQIERFLLRPCWYPSATTPETHFANQASDQTIVTEPIVELTIDEFLMADSNALDVAPISEASPIENSETQPESPSINRSLLQMLEDFVAKLDDTCHMLHVRMLADEAPYVATTSRLEHLAQETRKLVKVILSESRKPALNSQKTSPTKTDSRFDADDESFCLPIIESNSDASGLPTNEKPEQAESISSDSTRIDTGVTLTPMELPASVDNKATESAIPVEPVKKSRRILILEHSPFYRQLIGMAIESAGYEICAADFNDQGLQVLGLPVNFDAILIGPNESSEIAKTIESRRINQGTKVIALIANEDGQTRQSTVDETVMRSNPPLLIAMLDRVFNPASDSLRMSA